MKLSHAPLVRRRGLTLPEVLVSMAILGLVVAGLVSSQVFGLRLMTSAHIKLAVQDETRLAMLQMREAIRSAAIVRVGNGTATSFVEATNNALQQGNAIQVYPTANTNTFVRYYVDASDKKLKRAGDAPMALNSVAAITNAIVFRAEDPWGNVLTNHSNNRVIGIFIQSTCQHTQGVPGPVYCYETRTRNTRRALQ